MNSASTPAASGNGAAQWLTSPLDTAPRHMPRSTGVIALDAPKTRLQAVWVDGDDVAYERKTNAAPRSTMPMSTRCNGQNRAVLASANADGKHVNKSTM